MMVYADMNSREGRAAAWDMRDYLVFVAFCAHIALASFVGMALVSDINDPNAAASVQFKMYFYGTFLSGGAVAATTFSRLNAGKFKTNLLAVLPLLIVCTLSIVYSDYPINTRTYLIRTFASVLAVAGFVRIYGAAAAVKAMLLVLCAVNIASFIVSLAVPSIGVHLITDAVQSVHAGHWRGITGHKNALGRAASLAALILIFYPQLLSPRKFVVRVIIAISLINMFMAQSGTGIVSFFAGIAIYFLFLRRTQTIISTAVKVFGLSIALISGGSVFGFLLGLIGKNLTFSGRGVIWIYTWQKVQTKAFLGHGYGAGVSALRERTQADLFNSAVDAHNAFLYFLLDVGFIGMFCLLFAVAVAILRTVITNQNVSGPELAANRALALCLGVMLAISMTETAPFDICSNIGIITFIGLVAVARPNIPGFVAPALVRPRTRKVAGTH